jgi:SprT protein
MRTSEALALARSLLVEFKLWEWSVGLDPRATRRFGQCQHRTRRIGLSTKLVELNGRAEVEDVIRHEIAHALAGANAGHGRIWKMWCHKTGARPERCYSTDAVVTPKYAWTLRCPEHADWTTQRSQRRNGRYSHPGCKAILIWEKNS